MFRRIALLLTLILIAGMLPAWPEAPSLAEVVAPAVDPECAPADNAGDTGLEIGPDELWTVWDEACEERAVNAVPEQDYEFVVDDPVTESMPREPLYGQAEDASAGFYMVSEGTVADSLVTPGLHEGVFTRDSFVYCEYANSETGKARIRFDSEDSRNWGDDFFNYSVPCESLVRLTSEESTNLIRNTLTNASRTWMSHHIPVAYFEEYNDSSPYGRQPKTESLGTQNPSEAQIRAFYDANPIRYTILSDTFRQAATKDPYQPAKPTEACLNAALNLLRLIRYAAGLTTDIALDYTCEDSMAAKMLMTGLNGFFEHGQSRRPEVLADSAYDALYQKALNAPGSLTNSATSSTTQAVISYISRGSGVFDETLENVQLLLDPGLRKVMFATTPKVDPWLSTKGSYAVATETTGTGSQERVAWPAPHTPIEFFPEGSYWTLSYWHPKTLSLDYDHIMVTVVRQSDFSVWYAYPETWNTSYGKIEHVTDDSVMFNLKMDYKHDISLGVDYNVTVQDFTTGYRVRYTVNFFSLGIPASPASCQNVLPLIRNDGIHLSWNASDGATGYAVNRGTDGNGMQMIAEVPSGTTSFVDRDVRDGEDYVYSVYPYNGAWLGYGNPVSPKLPVPDSVTLNKSGTLSSPIFKDESRKPVTIQLTATVSPGYADKVLTWSSSDPGVAAVDQNGLVSPVGAGTATITVATDNGKTDSVDVNYYFVPPKSVAILDKTGLNNGLFICAKNAPDVRQLEVQFTPSYASTTLTWTSSNPKVAAVDSNGLVTPLSVGKTTIKVTTAEGRSDSVNITCRNLPPESVALGRTDALVLTVGDSARLNASITPSWAITTLSWKSDQPGVATVEDGLVKAVSAGSATVTATTDNGLNASVVVQVNSPGASPSASPTVNPDPPKALTDCKISISAQTYTGKALKPVPTVTFNGEKLTRGKDFTVSYTNNKNVGLAKAIVRGAGDFTGRRRISFKILPKGTTVVRLSAKRKAILVTWKKQARQVSGYQLQYSTNKRFKGAKLLTVSGATKVRATLKSLKSGKTYYVRIRTWRKVGKTRYRSKWSKAKRVKVK